MTGNDNQDSYKPLYCVLSLSLLANKCFRTVFQVIFVLWEGKHRGLIYQLWGQFKLLTFNYCSLFIFNRHLSQGLEAKICSGQNMLG